MSQLFVRLPKYWSFSFNISPSNEYSGLISLKIDWFDLHAVRGTFRSPSPQFESMNSLVLCLFYSLALKTVNDHWEDHSLGYPDFARRVTFLLFNTLSRFVIAFLPRNKLLLISWRQSPSTVILETEERKSVTTSTFSPSAAAAAKSLQSCPTLCNPIDGSPPGSAVPGILQARTLICYKMMGLDAIILVLVLSQLFHSPPSPSPRGSLVPLQFLPLEWCHLHF